MTEQQTPRVVIAARDGLIKQLGEIGGSRLTDKGREEIADWLISSGHLADSFYEAIAAGLNAPSTRPSKPTVVPSKAKRTDPAVAG